MDKQNVILKTQLAQAFEVIGKGGMVYEPCQIGEWWVMPADQYTGTIPPEIQAKWDNFKALNIPVLGYLIADDMREIQQKRELEAEAQRQHEAEVERQREVARQNEMQALERQRRKEEFDRNVHQAAEVGGKVLAGIGAVVVGAALAVGAIIGALLRFDPILIAVMPDGRWVCLGAWWD